jgi:hypothetical protein
MGSEDQSRPRDDRPSGLRLRVLARVLAGQSYHEIATAEYLSVRTVRRYVEQLKRRAGAASLAALGAEATRRGWTEPLARPGSPPLAQHQDARAVSTVTAQSPGGSVPE